MKKILAVFAIFLFAFVGFSQAVVAADTVGTTGFLGEVEDSVSNMWHPMFWLIDWWENLVPNIIIGMEG